MSQIHKPSTTPGTVFHLEGNEFRWTAYGGQYHIGTTRNDMAILPESGQVVKVVKLSGVTSWEKIGPLLERQNNRFVFEHVGPAFTPVADTKKSSDQVPLDAFQESVA